MAEQTAGKIRILIVDDHPIVRTGLQSVIETYLDLEVSAAVTSGEEALAAMKGDRPDVILLDLRMPGLSGIETLRALKKLKPSVYVMILTSFDLDEDIYQAIKGGADGYVMKNTPAAEIVNAIRMVAAGKRHIPEWIAGKLAERMSRSTLSARELGILELLTKGLTNKQIARVLSLSVYTVRNHVDSILKKLDVSDRTEASTTAIQQGLVHLEN
jgi:two-component system NarL family response regulator